MSGKLPDRPQEPTHRKAAALQYNAGDRAPQVVAAGQGHVAEQIIAAAEEAGVPIHEDPALATALAALDLGTEVPEVLYPRRRRSACLAYGLDKAALDAKRLR